MISVRWPGAGVSLRLGVAAAVALLAGMAKPGDVVVTMGAGDVTELGPRILARLAEANRGEH